MYENTLVITYIDEYITTVFFRYNAKFGTRTYWSYKGVGVIKGLAL